MLILQRQKFLRSLWQPALPAWCLTSPDPSTFQVTSFWKTAKEPKLQCSNLPALKGHSFTTQPPPHCSPTSISIISMAPASSTALEEPMNLRRVWLAFRGVTVLTAGGLLHLLWSVNRLGSPVKKRCWSAKPLLLATSLDPLLAFNQFLLPCLLLTRC